MWSQFVRMHTAFSFEIISGLLKWESTLLKFNAPNERRKHQFWQKELGWVRSPAQPNGLIISGQYQRSRIQSLTENDAVQSVWTLLWKKGPSHQLYWLQNTMCLGWGIWGHITSPILTYKLDLILIPISRERKAIDFLKNAFITHISYYPGIPWLFICFLLHSTWLIVFCVWILFSPADCESFDIKN